MARAESVATQFDSPSYDTHLRVFVVLWFVWAALLAAAMILGNVMERHGAALPTAARMGSSLVLVVTGWTAWYFWRGAAAGRFALWIAIGMTLGTVGDFFNANLLKFIPLSNNTLGGIGAFGLGHVAYIAGCFFLARRARLTNWGVVLAAIVFWQVVGVVAWYFVVFEGSESRDLVWPALPYSQLLAGTTGVATGLALQDRRLTWLAVGAALFLTSDLILAFGLFRGGFRYSTESVWLTYGPGQMLIVFSTICAAVVLAGTRAATSEKLP